MANANLKSAQLALFVPAEQKLEQVVALLSSKAKITPAMLKIRIRAIYEDIDVPTEMQEFLALAARAGICRNRQYATWARWHAGQLATGAPGTTSYVLPKEARRRHKAAETVLYRWYDEADILLYIGISDEFSERVASHVKGSAWMDFAVRSTMERCPARTDALSGEEVAIKAEHPIFNQKHNSTTEARQRRAEYLAGRRVAR